MTIKKANARVPLVVSDVSRTHFCSIKSEILLPSRGGDLGAANVTKIFKCPGIEFVRPEATRDGIQETGADNSQTLLSSKITVCDIPRKSPVFLLGNRVGSYIARALKSHLINTPESCSAAALLFGIRLGDSSSQPPHPLLVPQTILACRKRLVLYLP